MIPFKILRRKLRGMHSLTDSYDYRGICAIDNPLISTEIGGGRVFSQLRTVSREAGDPEGVKCRHAGIAGFNRDRAGDLLSSPDDGQETRPRTGPPPVSHDGQDAFGHLAHGLLDRGLRSRPKTLAGRRSTVSLARDRAYGSRMGRRLGVVRLQKMPGVTPPPRYPPPAESIVNFFFEKDTHRVAGGCLPQPPHHPACGSALAFG